ncbi:tRNA epoxyqueuosine(34) reductase QueG [uncultured Acetobacteroides sp.]|uniref:tRNA epoxyqueuosine(34) reductase QueG n=1 Tax=uncultured Acetobacteroides sp. TaxID=1760811 RepID=UPI0029F4D2E7|nr:tRNA epoxyqueuosine(34) reductase QueG [uncultured Acetobacteroides sp.]
MDASNPISLSHTIRTLAAGLGFDAVGFARAQRLDQEADHLRAWLDAGHHADMAWMEGHFDKRVDPTLLVDGAKSVVVVLLSYKPAQVQLADLPQIAKYAYGDDYHDVIKGKLWDLLAQIKEVVPEADGRPFVDSAPVLERAWAERAGLGWIGRSSLLINRQLGSLTFIGTLMLNQELEYGTPVRPSCGACTRCIDACPTGAIVAPMVVDAHRCISYQTIENRGEIPDSIKEVMGSRIFGCDACLDACPWNARVAPHRHPELTPREAILTYTTEQWQQVDEAHFSAIFRRSAVKRTKLGGFRRNLAVMLRNESKKNE